MHEIELSDPQTEFILLKCKYPLFVAGFGSGKSTTMVVRMMLDLQYPKAKVGAYAPTYDMLSLITAPYIEEMLTNAGIPYKYNKSENKMYLNGGKQIILRSLDNPARIVGYEVFRSHIDEIDTMPKKKAEDAWRKVIARNRQKVYAIDLSNGSPIFDKSNKRKIALNRVSAYTTPEGFNFAYDRWVKNGGNDYAYVKASTYSNQKNLPEDYIPSLIASYPKQLVDAYINGDFVNLTTGTVYYSYNRDDHDTFYVAKDGDPLHIGMDFNVNKMAAIVHVDKGEEVCAVKEYIDYRDTPDICRAIREDFPNSNISVYPDASGSGRNTVDVTETDISILKSFGFKVIKPKANPRVKNRVASMNNAFEKGYYRVNKRTCPQYCDCLEQQAYDDHGKPDKKSGHDHANDAAGYYISRRFPIKDKKSSKVKIIGV